MKQNVFRLRLNEAEYKCLLGMTDKNATAKCYTDYFFETEGFLIYETKQSLYVRLQNDVCTLSASGINGERFSKVITVSDTVYSATRGLPLDLLEDLPIKFPIKTELREFSLLAYTDVEERKVKLGNGYTVAIKDIDYIWTTGYELEFEYASETDKDAVTKYLKENSIGIPPADTPYGLVFMVWMKSLAGKNCEDNEISITFKHDFDSYIKPGQSFNISLKTEYGHKLHEVFTECVANKLGIGIPIWIEPLLPEARAKYVVKNLKNGLAKVALSDAMNRSNGNSGKHYKYFGITRKEYIAVQRAEADFICIIDSMEASFPELGRDVVVNGLSYKQIADKHFNSNVKKAENTILKFYKELEREYVRVAKVEDLKYPKYDELSPTHQSLLNKMFSIMMALNEYEIESIVERGDDKFDNIVSNPDEWPEGNKDEVKKWQDLIYKR